MGFSPELTARIEKTSFGIIDFDGPGRDGN